MTYVCLTISFSVCFFFFGVVFGCYTERTQQPAAQQQHNVLFSGKYFSLRYIIPYMFYHVCLLDFPCSSFLLFVT